MTSNRGGSRGEGSLGSNESPFLLLYSTYWILLLLPVSLTLSACVPVLSGYCKISVQSRASISQSVYAVKLVICSIFVRVEQANA